MRASELIETLRSLINENGDCYITRYSEDETEEMVNVENVEVVPYFETKYFYIK